MKQERFLFYTAWRKQLELLSDAQVKRFVINLCKYAEGEDIKLVDDIEKAVWFGIVPSLDINRSKYESRVETNRKNGILGGAPRGNQNARKDKTTQNNLISDNKEVTSGNSEEISDKGKEVIDKFKKNIEKS